MATLAQSTASPPAMAASSHPFTCNTCQVAFRSSDLQRTHMQSDWHRYNLKRRVASLPPLTSEIFAEKVLANKASAAATAARASFEKRCEACEKTYYSEGAYLNHLGSQKHKLAATRYHTRIGHETESMADSTLSLGDPIETASTTASTVTAVGDRDADAEEEFEEVVDAIKHTKIDNSTDHVPARVSAPAPSLREQKAVAEDDDDYEDDDEEDHKADLTQCLFCNYLSPTPDLNLLHMGRQHGFFVPEREFVVDLSGLINYLSETIHVLHQCLYCHKALHTTSGVQTHMRDRGHCMIAYATEDEQLEIGEFYDFRSTYSDDESEEEDERETNAGVSLGAKRAVKLTVENDAGDDVEMDEDDEGWESDSTVSSVPTDEITSIPIERKPTSRPQPGRKDSRLHKNSDGYHSYAHQGTQAVYHDDYELHLPSGRTAGHRSLRQYYRQNLRHYPTAEERIQQRRIDDGRHDSDADDEDATNATTTTDRSEERGRGRQLISRADGGLGMIGVSEAKKREIRAVEKREKKREQRAQARYQWGNDKRGNFQKHFRDHLLQ